MPCSNSITQTTHIC